MWPVEIEPRRAPGMVEAIEIEGIVSLGPKVC